MFSTSQDVHLLAIISKQFPNSSNQFGACGKESPSSVATLRKALYPPEGGLRKEVLKQIPQAGYDYNLAQLC